MRCTDGVSLEGLFFCSGDRLTGFRLAEVRAVKEGVDGCVAKELDTFVPMIKNWWVAVSTVFGNMI